MNGLQLLALLAGLGVVVVATISVLRNLVVPRRLSSKLRLVVSRTTSAPFRFIADRSSNYIVRDRVLAWSAPTALLALLITWLLLYLVGYG
ncbi:MAG: hypothetical protein ACHQE5_13305, partial [Actinomycetes bacterium]